MQKELIVELETAPHLVIVNGRRGIQRMAQRAWAAGELEWVLPGVYAAKGSVNLQARAVALSRAHPDAVIGGKAAAALAWWPELDVSSVDVTSRHRVADAPGFRWRRGSVPPELIVESNRIRLTAPALTVLDLIGGLGGKPIDEALRRGATDLPSMWEALALTPGRRGNTLRRDLLHDSRDLPWSEAERALHRIYRSLPPTAWSHTTNHRVALADGHAFLDLALPQLLLGFEVDGHEYHSDAVAFVHDRRRDPELAELGWLIVRFAAVTVMDDPDWVRDRLRGIIAGRAAELGLR